MPITPETVQRTRYTIISVIAVVFLIVGAIVAAEGRWGDAAFAWTCVAALVVPTLLIWWFVVRRRTTD